jgi:choline kinase
MKKLYFVSNRKNKKIPNKDRMKVITNKGLLDTIIINNNGYILVDVGLSQLKKLVKNAEKMKKHWSKHNQKTKNIKVNESFIHLNPEISFYVRYDK